MEPVNWSAWLLPILAPVAGWLLWTRLPSGDDDYNDPLETVFAVVLCGVFVMGLAALLLAELGILRPPILLLALAALSGALGWRRRLSPPTRRPQPVETLAFLLVVGLAVASVAPASEEVLGGRDPGVYANTSAWIAQKGTVRVRSEALADVGVEGNRLFFGSVVMPGFYVRTIATGEVSPQFFHLLPTYMAVGYWLGGQRGALSVPPVFGVLGIIAVFLFARRVLGVGPAVVAAALLVLNLAQVWVGRNPYSEPATQLGVFAALWCIAVAHRTGGLRWGVLGGIALGTCFLLRVDAPLLFVAIAPALVVMQAASRQPQRWITHGFLPVAVAAGIWGCIHGWIFSRPYVLALLHSVGPLWMVTAAIVALCGIALVSLGRVRRLVEWLHRNGRRAWVLSTVALCTAFVFALWIRPYVEPFEIHPRSGRRTYVEEALLRVGWYVSTPGLLAAVGGMALLLRQWLVHRASQWLPFVVVVLAFSLLYFWDPRIHADHPWMMRRFLPVVLPGITVAIAAAAAWLWAHPGRLRHARRAVAVAGVAYVLAHEVAMTLPFWTHREKAGVIDQLTEFAADVPEGSIVLFDYPGTEQRVAMPLAFNWLHDVLPVFRDGRRDPWGDRRADFFEAQVMRWLDEGREVQYLTRADGDWTFLTPNLVWEPVSEILLEAPVIGTRLAGPPQAPLTYRERFRLARARLALERLVPCAGAVLDMDGPVTGATQGLYGTEGRRRSRYRWAMPRARVLFPACDRSDESRPAALTVRAACWRPEENTPCDVKVSVNGVEAGVLDLTRSLREHVMPIPSAAVAESIGPVEVRFEGPEFIPATRGGRDHRSLSFQLSTIRVEGHPRATAREAPRGAPGNET